MGEIKGSLLTIVATIVTFGIISAGIFLAFDQLQDNVSKQISSSVSYSAPTQVNVAMTQPNLLAY